MYTYRIWNKASPINSCPAETSMQSLGIESIDEVYILVDESGRDCIVQTQKNAPYKGATIEKSAQNHINAILADQTAAAEAAKQPTQADILGQQVAALTLSSGQKDTVIQQLGAQAVQMQLDIAALKGGVA